MSKWIDRIDRIKKQKRLFHDKQVAELLGISQQSMSAIRKGGKLSVETKMKILNQLGHWNLGAAIQEAFYESDDD